MLNLLEKLTITTSKEVIRLSREVAEQKAISSVCVLVPSECAIATGCKAAKKQYDDATKGKSGHGLGPCDFIMCKTLLSLIRKVESIPPELASSIDLILPTLCEIKGFKHRVLSCKCLDTHDSSMKRLEISFGLPWRMFPYENDKSADLQILVANALESVAESRELLGKAPRNANVRKVSSLLDDLKKLGVKGIAKS